MEEEHEEINQKLDQILETLEENKKDIHYLKRQQKLANLMRLVYWILIIGLSYGIFAYMKPYMNNLLNMYTNTTGFIDSITDMNPATNKQIEDLKTLIPQLNKNK